MASNRGADAFDTASRTPLWAPILLMTLLAAPLAAGLDQALTTGWPLDLGDLAAPYNEATSITAAVLSDDGRSLVIGTDTGGILFLNATTGKIRTAWETPDHGAVHEIRLDRRATVVTARYENGYIAAVSPHVEEPLFTQYREQGAPDDVLPHLAIVPSPDGRALVVTGKTVAFYARGPAHDAPFEKVDEETDAEGPFVWFHGELPALGVLAPDGRVTLYTYNDAGIHRIGGLDLVRSEREVVALAVAGDGVRFAVLLDSGEVTRYTPNLDKPELIPDYTGSLDGDPQGVVLDHDGEALAAWGSKRVLWVSGCNRNEALCGGRTTEADTVRISPPFGARFTHAALTPDLSRIVVEIEGAAAERRLYNLPSQESLKLTGAGDAHDPSGLALLDRTGTRVYQIDGVRVTPRSVGVDELPPPAQREREVLGDHPAWFGLSTQTLLYGAIGLLALLLVVVVVAVAVAARRPVRAPPRPLGTLAPAPDEAFGALTMAPPAASGMPGMTRTVVPSAPPTAAPPEGHLVLQGVGTSGGAASLHGVDLAIKRPEVVRVQGTPEVLATFEALLAGHLPFTGTLAVGGVSARETPVLFRRRVQTGLAHVAGGAVDAVTAFEQVAAAKGLPSGLVGRRVERDLGWMGERLQRPIGALRPLDRWKVRLALALVDRPHVLVLQTADLPLVPGDAQRPPTLRRILSGIAHHYQVVVLLLDGGAQGKEMVRRLADEEVELTHHGIRDRQLLEDARPVRRPVASRGTRVGTPARPHA